MSTISIITCYMEWHRAVHLAPATRGGRLLADNQSLPTLILLTARLCSGDTKHWWHYPAGGSTCVQRPVLRDNETLETRHSVLSASGPQIGAILIMRYWDISRVTVPQSPLKHSSASVPARQFMLHSILKCIMNLYKRESLLSWYVFFYSSIILPTSIKHWSYFHGRWIFNQSGEGISVRISRSSCA